MYPAALMLLLGGQVWQGIRAAFLIATLVISLIDNLLEQIRSSDATPGLHELLVVLFVCSGGFGDPIRREGGFS
jgi:hypothetical protein